ncbi:MAG: molybdate ABC transporter substrate-binding protein [Alphaproteobacteria bacterium]|nr:molybdate ABC transporter substrate-binding protein [Alphaproteobacteria bacterium]
MRLFALIACFAALIQAPSPARAATTTVAVAANFTDAAKELAALFKTKTGHEAILSFGSSGLFYTQIKQGAPFHVLLSADAERPRNLVNEGFAVADSLFTYAIGRLVLWSKDPHAIKGIETLKANAFSKISIADPNAAPYGLAAIETLKALQIYDSVKPKIVTGTSIAQAFQFIQTGNAEIGFVALAQLNSSSGGSRWNVPQDLYTEIRQDAVLLNNGAQNDAAKAFMAFLDSVEARQMIERFGYVLAMKRGN